MSHQAGAPDTAHGLSGFGPPIAAGFVAILVGFASSAIIVYQAAIALGATPEQFGSWMFALALGMGVLNIGLSWRYRDPVVIAWSTPGAALLAVTGTQVPLAEAIGAFVFCGVLITLCGVTGWFERAMNRMPIALAAGLLAGVLVRFGLDLFVAMQSSFTLVFTMFATYLLGRRFAPRYAVIVVLGVGVVIAALQGAIRTDGLELAVARPHLVIPEFSWQAIVGLGIPLFVVTMASQNLPGVAVIRACGYATPVSPLISATGIATVALAPFGGYALNLAAITAAICMGREAHEDPSKRWQAAVAAGCFSLLLALFAGTVAMLFAAFPKELVLAIAGLALLGTIGNGLASAMAADAHREAALVTFLVTASGVALLGVGSAFWGLVAGLLVLAVQSMGRAARTDPR